VESEASARGGAEEDGSPDHYGRVAGHQVDEAGVWDEEIGGCDIPPRLASVPLIAV